MVEREGLTGSRVVAMIGSLYLVFDGINFLYNSSNIILGILELIFAIVIFLSLGIVKFRFKIPMKWWVLIIFGGFILLYGAYVPTITSSYFTGTILLIAALMELMGTKKEYKVSKIVGVIGAIFALYDCVILFMAYINIHIERYLVTCIIGVILVILLLLTMQTKLDIKIPFEWWIVLTIGFVFLQWVSPVVEIYAAFVGLQFAGFGGTIILITFVLLGFGF